MLAGVARIIEVSFIAPKFAPLPPPASMHETGSLTPADDNNSEHTLAGPDAPSTAVNGGAAGLWKPVQAFRHLPPLVRVSCIYQVSGS